MSTSFYNTGMIQALNNLNSISTQLAMSNLRLTTGKRVNSAADDPAGLIAATELSARVSQLDAMSTNGSRISSIIETADGAMSQIVTMLGTIESNAISAAGSTVSAEERAAYQAEIDSAIASIDRIVNTTTFNGSRLLDGALAYSTSGVNTVKITDVRVKSANTDNGDIDLDVAVVSAAEKGSISYSNGSLVDDVTFTITGPNGSETFTFASGSHPNNDILPAINAVSESLGVTASYLLGTLTLKTNEYGSDQTISIDVTDGTFVMDGSVTSDSGEDATVTVNGLSATADGLQVQFSNGTTAVSFSLKESFGNVGGGTETFTITGGGSGWSLGAYAWDKIYYGLGSQSSSNLGNDSLGMLSSLKSGGANALSTGNYYQASNIAAAALSQVSSDRARMGAIKTYTIDSSLNAYASAKEALSTEISNIMDLDYAQETANNNRLQLLMQMGSSVMSTLNQSYSSILSLLTRSL